MVPLTLLKILTTIGNSLWKINKESFIMANGRMVKNAVGENKYGLMVQFTKALSTTIWQTEQVD